MQRAAILRLCREIQTDCWTRHKKPGMPLCLGETLTAESTSSSNRSTRLEKGQCCGYTATGGLQVSPLVPLSSRRKVILVRTSSSCSNSSKDSISNLHLG